MSLQMETETSNGSLFLHANSNSSFGDELNRNERKRNFSKMGKNDTVGDVNNELIVQQARKRTKSDEDKHSDFNMDTEMECEQQNDGQDHRNVLKVTPEFELSVAPCQRCLNGEPGHYNHLVSANAGR